MNNRSFTQKTSLLWMLAMLFSVTAWAQSTVTGRVTSFAEGTSLPGVAVRIKGTSTGTVTDLDGRYQIQVPSGDAVLEFSFVGYNPEEVRVGTRSTIDVRLTEDIETLSEVVVVGYGTQRKSDLTGSVTSVSSEDFNKGLIATPDQLITGKVAGVQITPNGGAPGSGSTIRIRGGSSLNANNAPLIVIDGVPVASSGISGASDPLSFVNPDDIESINILKDASATAIYGSRASNGVVIITTKKGKANQKLSVNFSTLHSLSTLPNRVDVLSGDEYRAAVQEFGTSAQQALLGDSNTDWQDLIYRNAYSTDNNFNISGAYKSLPYRLSLGYLNQDGILLTSNFQRQSASLNLNPTFLDNHLSVNMNVKGIVTNSRFADWGAVGAAIAMDPTKPVYQPGNGFGGYYQWTDADGLFNPNATRNPLSMLEQRDDQGTVKRSIGNLQFDYKFHFLPELRANLNLGYDYSDGSGRTILPVDFAPVAVQGGQYTQYVQHSTNKLLDFYFNYAKEVTATSRLDATLGYSYQDFQINEPRFPTLRHPLQGNEDDIIREADIRYYPHNRLISLFGRVNYSLNDRYLFTGTLRRDGSSRFADGNRWGMFPSLAFAWRLSEEGFLNTSSQISDLKLRASYGITGQQDVGSDFPYLPLYRLSNATAQYQFGNDYFFMYRPDGYDPLLKWEETVSYNVGLDFGLLKNRITGSLDYYTRKTNDLLAVVDVAAGTNFTNRILTNVGNLETRGFEGAVNFFAINNKNLSWEIGVNTTINNIKITSLSRVSEENTMGVEVGGIGGGTGSTAQIHTVGYDPFSFFVYKQIYDESGLPIQGLYADLNGDGMITPDDRYRYKSPNPDLIFGLNSQLVYGKWNMGVVLRGTIGNYIYNNVQSSNANYANISSPGYLSNVTRGVYETNFTERSNEIILSDFYVENGSFMRLENLNVGYNVGNIFGDKANLRVSANVQNAFVITKYSGLDPEVFSGLDNNVYPRPRIFAVGLNVGF
jgi:TonB-dependent starch-binding outer membrane protein SusC